MEINKLNEKAIQNAKPGTKDYAKSDGAGLYLWVTTAGGKLWRWGYDFQGKEKLMSYGKYPDVGLARARELHAAARSLLAAGTDPMADRKAKKNENNVENKNSFHTIAKGWLAHWREGKSKRHANTVERRMNSDILPALGARPIDRIEAPEVVQMVKKIQDRGALDIAKRALETTGQIFRYAIAFGHAKHNPAAEIKPRDILKSREVVNFARIDRRDLPKLLKDIELYRGTQLTRLAMKLMALTFLRTTEMLEAQWTEFDDDNARWDVPKERMKMKKPHIVPLARQTLEVLDLLRSLSGDSKWVFPGTGPKNPTMSDGTILMALKRMGYKGEMTGHGFRGVASTILNESGYPSQHIDVQLAHLKKNKVRGAYDHAKYIEPRTRMMQDWADFLEETLRTGKVFLPNPNR
ncbi:MAG: integrase arm-type DNA-binding domain-containing protein [Terracidiphilus sp.]|jgi:integrase